MKRSQQVTAPLALLGLVVLAASLFLRSADRDQRTALRAQEGASKPGAKAAPSQFALLVGVTDYPRLNERFYLEGGANDVLPMKQLLTSKFAFPEKNILILSEAEGKKNPARLPTRANIKAECEKLAARIKDRKMEGDRVVVLLSGHGALQPEKEDVKDPYPDGCDRIFLPRDVEKWAGGSKSASGAIAGRELREWLRPIPEAKAKLWLILDACHSGEMARGGEEKVRQVKTKDLGIPDDILEKAATWAQKVRAAVPADEHDRAVPPVRMAQYPGVVLTYACQARQTTVEGRYPVDAPDAKPHGLLTFTIARVLHSAKGPITYRQLMAAVQSDYTYTGRNSPSPVLLGSAQHDLVLGEGKLGGQLILVSKLRDELQINAGRLHGLTKGSILAVKPPIGEEGEVKGHIKIVETRSSTSLVEPCPLIVDGKVKMKAPEEGAILKGQCEIVEIDFGDLRLEVAIDRKGSTPRQVEDKEGQKKEAAQMAQRLKALEGELQAFAGLKDSPIKVVADVGKAKWLVRLEGGELYLVRAQAAVAEGREKKRGENRQGPVPAGREASAWMKESFTRIARVQLLTEVLARQKTDAEEEPDRAARIKLELNRRGEKEDATIKTVKTFYHNDRVVYRLTNTGKVPVDATVLYVNSDFGITALFPLEEDTTNTIEPGKYVDLGIRVEPKTIGLEKAVVLAVKSDGKVPPVDFLSLTQQSITSAEKAETKRGIKEIAGEKKRGLGSDVGQVLTKARFGEGQTRMTREVADTFAVEVLEVEIAENRPGPKE